MELVGILRVLWDRRIIVALGVVVAVAAGLLAGRGAGSAAGSSGVGSVRMVLDTADSQLVEAAPKGADTLSMRAGLLANALATDMGTSVVARDAGVADAQLVVLGPAATRTPAVETPLVRQVAQVTANPNVPYVVKVNADDVTPIISVEAYAPDASEVARLTRAAVAGLRSLLVAEDGTRSRGFVLEAVAPLRTEEVPSGAHGPLPMLGAALATFVFWCVCIVLAVGAARGIRRLGLAARRA
jgi:hypothetical protein